MVGGAGGTGRPVVGQTDLRSVTLTDRGKAFASHVVDILAQVQTARLAVQTEMRTGTLRVSVPVPMGRMLAGPVIAEFRRRLPGVYLEIKLQNRRVDLVKDGLDVAIVAGSLADSELIARKLTAAGMWLYASARFEAEADAARTASIPFIAAPGDAALIQRSRVVVALDPPVAVVDDRTAVADALVWGAGAGLLPSFLGEPACAQGKLVRLHAEPIATLPVYALYHASQRGDPRLQVLIDEIARQLNNVL